MVTVLALALCWSASITQRSLSAESWQPVVSNDSDMICKTLLFSTQKGWPERGVLVTHCRTQSNTLVVQVSKIDKRRRTFSRISEDMLLARDSYNANGVLINRDKYSFSSEAGISSESLRRVILSFCALPVAKSLLQRDFELTVISNSNGFQVLAELTTNKIGDWISVMFDKRFQVKRKTVGY